MDINNNTIINVCNYMPIKIIASTSAQNYVFEPCQTDTPVSLPMMASEVKEIHSTSKIIMDGYLSFEDDVREDVYKFLRISNGKSILNQKQIMDAILSGNREDLLTLINTTSKGFFERVYGVYVALKQSGRYDISMRVAQAIEFRYKELLQQGIVNTKIKITEPAMVSTEKDEQIKEQEKLLEKKDAEMAEMGQTVDALKAQIKELTQLINSSLKAEDTATKPAPKKAGRPAKK